MDVTYCFRHSWRAPVNLRVQNEKNKNRGNPLRPPHTPHPPSPSIRERWLNGLVWSLFSMDTSLYSNYDVHTYSRIHRTVRTILTKCCTQYIAVDSLHYSTVQRLPFIFYFLFYNSGSVSKRRLYHFDDGWLSSRVKMCQSCAYDTWCMKCEVLQTEFLKLCLVTEVICTY